MAKNLAPLNRTTFIGYLGFEGGLPDTRNVYDANGRAWRADIFVTRSAAKKRFEDVRRVRIIVEENNWNALAAIDAPAAEPVTFVAIGCHNGEHSKCPAVIAGLRCACSCHREGYGAEVADMPPPEPAKAQVPAAKPPLDYWARVLDGAVEELHLLSGDNPPRGRSVMPLTVTLTTMAMHIRNGSVMPTPATPEANAQGSGARTDPDAYAIRTDDPIVASPASAPPHSPQPFTAEEAREEASAFDSKTQYAVTFRRYADLLERDAALERAAESALKLLNKVFDFTKRTRETDATLANLRSVLQRAKESR